MLNKKLKALKRITINQKEQTLQEENDEIEIANVNNFNEQPAAAAFIETIYSHRETQRDRGEPAYGKLLHNNYYKLLSSIRYIG